MGRFIVAGSVSPDANHVDVNMDDLIVFRGDYDTGDLTQWAQVHTVDKVGDTTGYCTYSICVQNGGPGHETAARFEVREGDTNPSVGGERAEVRAGSWHDNSKSAYFRDGDEVSFEFSIKFDESWVNPRHGPNSWFILYQWFSDGGLISGAPLTLMVTHDDKLQVGSTQEMVSYRKTIGPINPGQWETYRMNVRFSQSDAGYVEVWRNGELVVPKHFRPTLEPGRPVVFLKQGIYRDAGSTGTQIVWHDDLVVRRHN